MLDMVNTSAMSNSYFGNGLATVRFEQYTSLQQVIELLRRLEKKSSNVEKLAKELDTEENSVGHFIRFLRDMQWIKEDDRDLWSITQKGDIWLHNIQNTMEER
jgi:predicted transcriptional regulator